MLSFLSRDSVFVFFFFNDTATTEIYTLSLHDALPIRIAGARLRHHPTWSVRHLADRLRDEHRRLGRSEEHTSELQSRRDLVCRLLLENKKTAVKIPPTAGNTTSRTTD